MYIKREVAQKTGKRPQTINFYVDQGLIVPDIEDRGGRGKPMVFSDRNLTEVVMISHMSRMGLSLEMAGLALSILRKGKWTSGEAVMKALDLSTEKALKKIEQATVHFEDFWVSDKYGRTEDVVLLFMQTIDETSEILLEVRVEKVSRKNEDEGFKLPKRFDPGASVVQVVFLGSIRVAAEKNLV